MRRTRPSAGFTLLEILLASAAAAIILVAVYGVFNGALRMRDNATARIRESRLRARAAAILRRDLQGALISGGVLANTLEGDSNKTSSLGPEGPPGYLRMTTTTGKDTAEDLFGDTQEVEYYLAPEAPGVGMTANGSSSRRGGALVRAVTRDLLATGTTVATRDEERILTGVESMKIAFYDGVSWQENWQADPSGVGAGATATATPTPSASPAAGDTGAGTITQLVPEAIRVDIQQSAPSAKDHAPPPLQILFSWTTQPFTAPTPSPTP